MVRFQPDGWLEGLLRPLVLMDPKASVYFEVMAPDWRFALMLAFVVLAASVGRLRLLAFPTRQLLIATFVVLYVWTFAIGNGRYFVAALLLAGPLLVAVWRTMPGTAAFRWTTLAAVALVQAGVVSNGHETGRWGLALWGTGDAVKLPESPIRESPAVFITTTAISYSILVPKFHPDSRWANVVGQSDLVPGMREYPLLLNMLGSELPKYAVMPIAFDYVADNGQPTDTVLKVYADLLSPLGLRWVGEPCTMLPSNVAPGRNESPPARPPTWRGFWFCPIQYEPSQIASPASRSAVPARTAEVFAKIELRCPRFFPPGAGNDRRVDDGFARHYPSDARLLAYDDGQVYLKYFRSLNASHIGTEDDVLEGRFELPCDKLPGRYQFPWNAD